MGDTSSSKMSRYQTDPVYRERMLAAAKARRIANPEYNRNYSRWWRQTFPDKARESGKKYKAKHVDAVRACRRAWKKRNRERLLAAERMRYWKNLEKERARQQAKRQRAGYKAQEAAKASRRRARLARAPLVEKLNLSVIASEQDGCCAYCVRQMSKAAKRGEMRSDTVTLDHVVPLTCGGSHVRSNVVAACWECNMSKGNIPLALWLGRPDVAARLRAHRLKQGRTSA